MISSALISKLVGLNQYPSLMDKQLRKLPLPEYTNGRPKVNYPDRFLIPFISIAIGFFMVQIGENRPWPLWSDDRRVNESVFSSIACTACVMISIGWATRSLDRDLPWRARPLLRIVLQYLLCGLLPAILVAGWQYLFFLYMGVPLRMEGYIRDDFPVVHAFILIWNLFYLGCYFYSTWRTPSPVRVSPAETDPAADSVVTAPATVDSALVGDSGGELLDQTSPAAHPDLAINWAGSIALIESQDKMTVATKFDGETILLDHSVKYYSDFLAGNDFYLVRRGKLVNRAAIAHAEELPRNYVLTLVSLGDKKGLTINTKLDDKGAFKRWYFGS